MASSPPELRLLVVGRKGAGKSATGNTILGGKYFDSRPSGIPVTKESKREYATVQGRKVLVVDTPCFSSDAVQQEVQKCHELCSPEPHAVLLIVRLGRLTEEEIQAINTIQRLFWKEVPSRTILVFTNADMLRGESIQDFISKQSENVQKLVEMFNHRFLAINNKDPGDGGQVAKLLQMVDHLLTEIRPQCLVLLGRTGTGKSATGNTILGGKYFDSRPSGIPVTKESKREYATVQGRKVLVVDTPCFFSAMQSHDAVQQEVQKCHELCSPEPHAVLLIVRLGRLTEEEIQAVDTIQRLFWKEVPSRTILVFTNADMLRGESIQDFISKQSENVQKLVEMFNHRFLAINNKDPGDGGQVAKLLQMVDRLHTEIKEHFARFASPQRLVLLGRTGTGKSATGNTILGEQHFKSELSFSSVTRRCQRVNVSVQGRALTLIDTPGLFDTSLSQRVHLEVVRCLTLTSPGPHAILLTVKIGSPSEEVCSCVDLMEELFQTEVRRYTILIFTHADYLEGTRIEDYIRDDEKLQQLVKKFDSRYLTFNNMDLRDCSQVTRLLEMVDGLMAHNGNQYFTSRLSQGVERAASELLSEAKDGGKGGKFKEFYAWCRNHPYIAGTVFVGSGLLMGGPLAMAAMAPAAAVEVGITTQLINLMVAMGLEEVALNAIVVKLAAMGLTVGPAAPVGPFAAVLASCCIQ